MERKKPPGERRRRPLVVDTHLAYCIYNLLYHSPDHVDVDLLNDWCPESSRSSRTGDTVAGVDDEMTKLR